MFKVGSGSLQYELVEGWEQLPSGFKHADVAGVCSDSDGNVYLFCRGDHPVMVYDRDGRFLHAWGEGEFSYRTHGMYMGKDDFVYLVDDSNHSVGKYTRDGKLVFKLGRRRRLPTPATTTVARRVRSPAPPAHSIGRPTWPSDQVATCS